MTGRLRHILLGLLAGILVVPAGGQSRRELLDSLSNPEISAAGKAMDFAGRQIVTDTLAEEGGPYRFEYRWRNTGEVPVTILRSVTTCGCAVASFDRRPVPPGGESILEVTYYPKGHPGKFSRRIFLYTDLSGTLPAAVLELSGYVEPSVRPTWNYPFAMGPLLLKRKEVRMSGKELQTERILCFNAGESMLEMKADTNLLPPCLSVHFEPEKIAPGAEADIVVRFDPSAVMGRLPEYYPVVLEGLELPPSSRMIKVIYESENK